MFPDYTSSFQLSLAKGKNNALLAELYERPMALSAQLRLSAFGIPGKNLNSCRDYYKKLEYLQICVTRPKT